MRRLLLSHKVLCVISRVVMEGCCYALSRMRRKYNFFLKKKTSVSKGTHENTMGVVLMSKTWYTWGYSEYKEVKH